jgi:hypothetical protein
MGIFSFVKAGKKTFNIVKPKIAKRLTERRKETDAIFNIRKKAGAKPNTGIAKAIKKVTKIQDKFDKGVAARSAKIKSTQRKAIGAGAAAAAGATVAHGAAKKKFPKYKKVMESDVVIKGGKLGLREKKMGGGMMGRRMGYSQGSSKGKVPTTPKEKSLAKLAPPKDKITFGDVVAGRTKGKA